MTINILVIDEAGESALLSGCKASWRTAKKRACQEQQSGRERKTKLEVSWACPLLPRLLSRAAPRDCVRYPANQLLAMTLSLSIPAGVINPGERAKNEMSLIQTVEIPKQIKKDTFL